MSRGHSEARCLELHEAIRAVAASQCELSPSSNFSGGPTMRLRTGLLSALVVLPAGGLLSGGWAVVTVENPPERLVVGVPYTLEYSVRQHGVELQSGLRGRVEATMHGRIVRV